ncbi:hypothetical protein [Priestia megaterium]|uniref:hypothetical protein n=1 Tax=Priestia megaterium TaxID=1404 RepID=UPI000BFC5E0B|nr:hypothetical protein [Priestia megaterium]PGO60596.1 hypothetical protein CN981_08590 [Priestia megaterium]
MDNTARIAKTMALVTQIWMSQPEMRFNQIVHNLQSEFYQKTGQGIRCFDYTKDEFTGALEVRTHAMDMFYVTDENFIPFLEEKVSRIK